MTAPWTPGRDRRAVRHPGPAGRLRPGSPTPRVVVLGGGIAGLAAAVGLAERGVGVTLLEREPQLGGRVRAWPVQHGPDRVTMSRGFHAFFRQYYNLRTLLRRADPTLSHLVGVADYPLWLADGPTDSFARIPRTPPFNLLAFVAQSPSFTARGLAQVDVGSALELLDVAFPRTFTDYDGESAEQFLDRLNFPDLARHLALEVFARSFFARPSDFSAGELVAMFHTYFLGSAEGLLFDVPDDDYDTALWTPLGRYLAGLSAVVHTGATADRVVADSAGVRIESSLGELHADAVVVATDLRSTRALVERSELRPSADGAAEDERAAAAIAEWRQRLAATRNSPPYAVWRLWLDRPVHGDRQAFLGTSGYGPLDNVTVLERFEAGAAAWTHEHHGSVLEVHAYALDPIVDTDDDAARQRVRDRLRAELSRVYPETAPAQVVAEEWLLSDDCPLVSTTPWRDRPEVRTPDPRLVLAGDGVRCDFPVALMERAATTGWQAANTLLQGWGLAGHDLWTVPMQGRHPAVVSARQRLTHRVGPKAVAASS